MWDFYQQTAVVFFTGGRGLAYPRGRSDSTRGVGVGRGSNPNPHGSTRFGAHSSKIFSNFDFSLSVSLKLGAKID